MDYLYLNKIIIGKIHRVRNWWFIMGSRILNCVILCVCQVSPLSSENNYRLLIITVISAVKRIGSSKEEGNIIVIII